MTTLPTLVAYAGVVPDKSKMDKTEFANSMHGYLNFFNTSFTVNMTDFSKKMNNLSAEITSTAKQMSDNKDVVVEKEALIAPHYTAIEAVYENATNINATAGSLLDLKTVADSIMKVNSVATDIEKVSTTAQSIEDINTVAQNMQEISIVKENINDVNIVSKSIENINKTTNSIEDINKVAQNMQEVLRASENAFVAKNVANYKGDWLVDAQYDLGETVSFKDGFNYISKVDENSAEPIGKSCVNWHLIENGLHKYFSILEALTTKIFQLEIEILNLKTKEV